MRKKDPNIKMFLLRIPNDMREKMSMCMQKERNGVSQTKWILRAIEDKILEFRK